MKRIKLTRGKFALVDDEDFEFLSKWKWRYDGRYASKGVRLSDGSWATLRMHRLIALPHKGEDTDHINRDKLDNRRPNLRVCTHSENSCNKPAQSNNTSGYKGVDWRECKSKWRATIQVGGVQMHLGYFDTKAEAALGYNTGALKHHGEFAHLNVIKDKND